MATQVKLAVMSIILIAAVSGCIMLGEANRQAAYWGECPTYDCGE